MAKQPRTTAGRSIKASSPARRHRGHRAPWLGRVLPELLEARQLLSASYMVSNTNDAGAGSLRQAILDADAGGVAAQINLSSLGAGTQSIALASALPQITVPLTIDAAAQGVLLQLNGAGAGTGGVAGLDFEAGSDGSTINGLAIDDFSGAGVVLASSGDTVSHSFLGIDPAGQTAMPNNQGILVSGSNASILNDVISGNNADGIYISGSGATVQGNLIGTDGTGELPVPNSNMASRSAGITVFGAGNTLIGGLSAAQRNVISGNARDGVQFLSDAAAGNVIEGNYIGLDVNGGVSMTPGQLPPVQPGNGSSGIDLGGTMGSSVDGVLVTGNVIGANQGDGVFIVGLVQGGVLVSPSTGNVVAGNLIGTDANGNEATDNFGNPVQGNFGSGVFLDLGATGNLVGGAGSAARNVIASNQGNGITVQAGAGASGAANTIAGNYLGTDPTGMIASGNFGDGVDVTSGNVTISNNLISGNGGGLYLAAGGSVVTGNLIGTQAGGSGNLGNQGDGIEIVSSGNQVGGTAAGAGNVIAWNVQAGVAVVGVNSAANAIRGNAIFSNTNLGIDLGANGVTTNDSLGHAGPNDYLDFPVLNPVSGDATGVSITGTYGGAPSTSYTLDFYASAASDPTNHGQGQTYLGSMVVTTDASGAATFATPKFVLPAGQLVLSATATDLSGNTSEFALDQTATIASMTSTVTNLTSSMDPSTLGQSVTFTATIGGFANPTGTVTFMEGSTVLATVTLAPNSNVATWSTAALPVGTATITAVYSGDAHCTGSTGSVNQQVTRALTTTSVSASTDPSLAGQSVTFVAVVSGAVAGYVPSGTVTFMDGNVELGTAPLGANGQASFTTAALALGSHTITAIYNSDSNFCGSQGQVTQVVNAPPASISGTVFNDRTGDGLSSDDTAMGSVTVQLYLDKDGNATLDAGDGAPIATTVSDLTTGTYAFTNLAPGKYFVEEVTPTGFVRTAPTTAAYYTISLGSASVGNQNFDNYQTCTCSGSLKNVKYIIDGCRVVTDLRGNVHQGDTVKVQFTVTGSWTHVYSLVSYTAPGSSFNASTASQQKIYQDAWGTFGPGTYTLSVVIPKCYFQVDFVCGYAIDQFGPAGSNIFYSAQDRLISADNGGTRPPPAN